MPAPKRCPFCDKSMPRDDVDAEVRHMNERHPDVVVNRLIKAGIAPHEVHDLAIRDRLVIEMTRRGRRS